MITDNKLQTWPSYDVDWHIELIDHFDSKGGSTNPCKDWIGVSKESCRMYGLATGVEIEEGSPIAAFFYATAAYSFAMAVDHIASALGIDDEWLIEMAEDPQSEIVKLEVINQIMDKNKEK